MAIKSFSEWILKETDIPPAETNPPQQPDISGAARQSQAHVSFDKFIDFLKNQPAPQWEIYIKSLIDQYQNKFQKEFSQISKIAKGTASNITTAQKKLDKQQMDIPTTGGAMPTNTGQQMPQ